MFSLKGNKEIDKKVARQSLPHMVILWHKRFQLLNQNFHIAKGELLLPYDILLKSQSFK